MRGGGDGKGGVFLIAGAHERVLSLSPPTPR